MFEQDVISTFSDRWYMLAETRPRLSPHAHVTRQAYGPHLAYIVEEPASGNYYRLSESAWYFLGLLDGTRTVQDAWDSANALLGDEAPTQRECLDLLSQLQLFGLLMGDQPIAADMTLERRAEVRRQRLAKRTGRWLFYSVPLFNPEPLLQRHRVLVRLLFSRFMLVVWLAVVATGLLFALSNARQLGGEFNLAAMLKPGGLLIMGLVFLALRAMHEMGHAAACKAMGGRSTEIGVILIVFLLPLPYCDATSAWRFPEIWRRVLVSAAGVMVELFIAAIAAVIWATTEENLLIHSLCYQVMFLSSITTFLFNLNPLLRYDGYYILSDVTGVSNLAMRSRELVKYLVERFVFGIRGLRPPRIRDRTEAWVLGLFALASTPYRLLISLTILLIIASRYTTLGLVLAVVAGCVWLIWPMLKGIGYLASSPKLIGRRMRAITIVGGFVLVVSVLLGAIPMPAGGYASGVVEPMVRRPLRAVEPGIVARVLVEPGRMVRAGEPVFVLENEETTAALAGAKARLEQASAELDQAQVESAAKSRIARERLHVARATAEHAQRRVEDLVIRAPAAGRLVPASGTASDLRNLPGHYVQRGTLLGSIATTDTLVVRALVSDRQQAYLFPAGFDAQRERRSPRAKIRVRGRAGRVIPAAITRVQGAGMRTLETPALSARAGGDVLMDPTNPKRTLVPHFTIELVPAGDDAVLHAGLRARVRIGIGSRPLIVQWWRRARQYLSGRLGR